MLDTVNAKCPKCGYGIAIILECNKKVDELPRSFSEAELKVCCYDCGENFTCTKFVR